MIPMCDLLVCHTHQLAITFRQIYMPFGRDTWSVQFIVAPSCTGALVLLWEGRKGWFLDWSSQLKFALHCIAICHRSNMGDRAMSLMSNNLAIVLIVSRLNFLLPNTYMDLLSTYVTVNIILWQRRFAQIMWLKTELLFVDGCSEFYL